MSNFLNFIKKEDHQNILTVTFFVDGLNLNSKME